MKAHLTNSLTPGFLRSFKDQYATLLNLKKLTLSDKKRRELKDKQQRAVATAKAVFGRHKYKRVLYFGGKHPADGGAGAKKLLVPKMKVVFVRDMVTAELGELTHLEGDEPLVRVINMLAGYRLLKM